ncbi:hypothetical protein HMPREF3156_00476 [Neisseria sp. HMSC06F02]|nr:hypothetical protein HMPREF3156_00476 [Neisseria sp. HMSC06F02]
MLEIDAFYENVQIGIRHHDFVFQAAFVGLKFQNGSCPIEVGVGIVDFVASVMQDGQSAVVVLRERRVCLHAVLGVVFVKVETFCCKKNGANSGDRKQQFFQKRFGQFCILRLRMFHFVPFASVVGIDI